jgi:hypothetical protein
MNELIIEKCWITTRNTPPLWIVEPNQQGGVDMERQTQLVAFRQNHVKLAWPFINIKNVVIDTSFWNFAQ